ncbi:MAG: cation:proton antiporter domain-containing protein [Elusimicrobiota bacterium]
MSNAGPFLFTVGFILYLGVVGSYIFERYRIPDVVNLILIGLLLGPVLHLVNPSVLTPWMPFVGAVALSLILFEGGLDLDFDDVVARLGFSFLLGTITFAVTMGLIVFFYRWIAGAPWLHCLLLGSVLGCVSSAVILPVAGGLGVPEKTKAAINLEAVVSDLLGVLITLVLLRVGAANKFDPGQVVNQVVGSFAVAVVGAGALGLLWLWVLDRLRKSPFAYMMTLASVFVLYGLTEIIHGSGPMAALTFGVVLTNADKIAGVFGRKFKFELDEKIRWFNTEATFFARTFFFVYLGLVVSLKRLDWAFLQVAAAVFLAVLAARYAAVRLILRFYPDERSQSEIYMAMVPRGLTSAVLAGMVWAALPSADLFLDYAFIAILLTNFFMTAVLFRMSPAAAPKPSVVK